MIKICTPLLLALLFCAPAFAKKSEALLGSKKRPIKIAFVPGQDAGVLQSEGGKLSELLKKETGLEFQILVPHSFIAVVETIGSVKTDIALINSFGYLLANEKYGARVRLIGTYKGKREYWGQIITARPEIKKITDLNGKRFGFVDPASTSGYILPQQVLQMNKVKLAEQFFAGKHDSVVVAVYQGRVDAGATYHMPAVNGEPQDARGLLKTQYPDVYEKIRIVQTLGPIPSDPLIFRKNFPSKIEESIVQALLKIGKTPEGSIILKTLYNVTEFEPATDADYEPLRKIIHSIKQSKDN